MVLIKSLTTGQQGSAGSVNSTRLAQRLEHGRGSTRPLKGSCTGTMLVPPAARLKAQQLHRMHVQNGFSATSNKDGLMLTSRPQPKDLHCRPA